VRKSECVFVFVFVCLCVRERKREKGFSKQWLACFEAILNYGIRFTFSPSNYTGEERKGVAIY